MVNKSAFEINKSVILGWVICTLGAVFYCYEYLLRIEPSVMVSQLQQQYGLSAERFGMLTALYYVAYTPMQMVVGVLTDIYGPRKMLTMAVAVCTVGSFLFGYGDTLLLAGTGRFLIGFGSAFAFVGVLKLAAIWLPSERFALFAGLATALGMVGAMVGDVELSLLVNRIGWQETIFISTLAGVVLTPLIWIVIRDAKGVDDPVAATLVEQVSVPEAFAGLGVIARNKQMWIAGFVGLSLYLSLTVFAEVWGITFLNSVYGYSPKQAAFATSMVFFGWLVGAPVMGYVSDHLKSRRMPLVLGCIFSLLTILVIIYVPDLSYRVMLSLLFLFGVFSSTEVICFAVGRENCPHHMSGAAIAFINMLVMFGGLAFQPMVGYLLDTNWSGTMQNGVRAYTAVDYSGALAIIPVTLVLGLLVSFAMKESYGMIVEEA